MNSTATVDNLGIPPLAGVCTYERAALPGLGVERTTEFLKRCNYVLRRLHEAAAAHLAATPEWEVKCGLGLHLWLDAEHCSGLRARVAEMREPPLHLDDAPDEALRAALEELLRASDTAELVTGVYGVVRPALANAVRAHLAAMNPLFDHPTYRLLRGIEREQDEMIAWGEAARAALTDEPGAAARAAAFADHLERYLAAAGGIAGGDAVGASELPAARWDGSDYAMDPEPKRDARFVDRFNCSARIDDIYADESRPADERAYALVHKRLREMDVPEWMAPILFLTRGRPWEYYRELGRQLWDETRHAMMGEVALHAAGVPFYDVPDRHGGLGVAELRVHAARGAHPALGHRAGADAARDGQALGVDDRRPRRRPAARRAAGLRLGRRGAARPDRPSLAGRRARHRRRAQGRREGAVGALEPGARALQPGLCAGRVVGGFPRAGARGPRPGLISRRARRAHPARSARASSRRRR